MQAYFQYPFVLIYKSKIAISIKFKSKFIVFSDHHQHMKKQSIHRYIFDTALSRERTRQIFFRYINVSDRTYRHLFARYTLLGLKYQLGLSTTTQNHRARSLHSLGSVGYCKVQWISVCIH